MNKLKIVSKVLHVLVLLSFFLPFYPTGCNNSRAEEQARMDSLKKDSIIKDSLRIIQKLTAEEAQKRVDSIVRVDSIKNAAQRKIDDSIAVNAPKLANSDSINSTSDTTQTIQKTSSKETTEDYQYASKLAQKNKFFKLIFKPDGNYTGMGYIIDNLFPFVFLNGIIISMILLIIGLFLKFLRKRSRDWLLCILSVISLLGIYITIRSFLFANLWGYWVCMISLGIMTVLDLIIAIKSKVSRSK